MLFLLYKTKKAQTLKKSFALFWVLLRLDNFYLNYLLFEVTLKSNSFLNFLEFWNHIIPNCFAILFLYLAKDSFFSSSLNIEEPKRSFLIDSASLLIPLPIKSSENSFT